MICSVCNGLGTVVQQENCSICNGSGYTEELLTCPDCEGSGYIRGGNCFECGGNGTVNDETCNRCSGSSKEADSRCDRCQASGQITQRRDCPATVDVQAACKPCNGTGQIADPTPVHGGSGGEVGAGGVAGAAQCDLCHGRTTVVRRVKCKGCQGRGTVPDVCDACGGKAWVDTFPLKSKCVFCDAIGMSLTKTRDHADCGGTGGVPEVETCPKCNGKGTVTA